MKSAINTGCLAALMLLTGCKTQPPLQTSQPPSDAYIRKKVVGTWRSDSTHSFKVNSHGSFVSTSEGDGRPESVLTFRGKWRVTNGWFLMTVAEADGEIADVSDVESNKVVRIDDHEWVVQGDE